MCAVRLPHPANVDVHREVPFMKKILQAGIAFVVTMAVLWLALFAIDYTRITNHPFEQKDLVYTVSQEQTDTELTQNGIGYSVVYSIDPLSDGITQVRVFVLGKLVWAVVS